MIGNIDEALFAAEQGLAQTLSDNLLIQYGLALRLSSEKNDIFSLTALSNNMRILNFKSQPTNAFFVTVNQMFGGSSQLTTTAERAVIKSNRREQFRQHSWKLGGAAEYLIDGSEKCICRLSFEF